MQYKVKRINYKWITKYLIYLVLFIIMTRAKLTNIISPFALGLFLGLVFLRQNIIMLSIFYTLSAFIFSFSYIAVIICVVQILLVFTIMFIYYKLRKEIKPLFVLLYSLLISLISLPFNLQNVNVIIETIISACLSVCFTFVVITTFNAIVIRGIAVRTSIDEKMCFLIFSLGVFLGLYGLNLYGVDITKFIFTFILLVLCFSFPFEIALSVSVIMGIAGLVYNGLSIYMLVYTMYAVLGLAFKNVSKYLMPVIILLVDILLGLYFKVYVSYTYFNLIPIVASGLIFICFPKKSYIKLRELFISPKEEVLVRDIINRNREQMSIRLLEISDVFREMQRVFVGMVKSSLTKKEAVQMLVAECKSKVCSGCIEKEDCYFRRKNSDEDLNLFIESSLSRGKSTVLDLPRTLANSCKRINALLSVANGLVLSYNEYVSLNSNMNNSRILIGQQMGAVSGIIEELSKDLKVSIIFDKKKENIIIDELLKKNIICNEVIIYELGKEKISVNLIIKKSTLNEKVLIETLSKLFKQKMMLVEKSWSNSREWTSVHLRNSPAFDIVFGASGVKKWGSDKSGDTHSLIKVQENKFILALCDGMGSGDNAERVSSIAISLVENFYKAGFENEIILNSVNKLLGIGGEETFTAIDISVIDLQKGVLDSIKIGAVCSFIKRGKNVDLLQGSSLPMGVLEEMKPSISKNMLNENNIIIMVTDGVVDAFFDEFNLRQFIFDLKETNPQRIADLILSQAVKLSDEKPKDDMTVICGRLFCDTVVKV